MATTIETNAITCKVCYNASEISVTGSRSTITIDLNTAEFAGLTDTESTLLVGLENEGPANTTFDASLTREEMRLFLGIKAKCDAANGKRIVTQVEEMKVEAEAKVSSDIDADLRKREHLLRALKSTSEDKSDLFRIVYYIPTKVSAATSQGGKSKFGNLAGRMRAAGLIQFDGSTYCGKAESIPHEVFSEMNEWNETPAVKETAFLSKRKRLVVKYRCEKIHPEQLAAIREEAFEQLRDHVVEVHESLLESIDEAAKTLDATVAELERQGNVATTKDLEKAHKRRISNVGSALSASKKRLADAIKAATIFDETESLEPLFAGLREAIISTNAALIALRRAQV